VKADILKKLLQAHADADAPAFRKAALQLAATESSAGHTRIAAELREIIARLPASPRAQEAAIDIAQPRGELSGLLAGGHREERLKDIVLPSESRARLERVLQENRARTELQSWGVAPSRRLLFYGPPGCGKTLAASVLAGELGVPLMTVRFDGLFSRFLGATAGHLKVIFDEMPRRPAVYLFDEFDAVAKSRGDAQEVGEVRRVVTSFLQLMDADRSGSVIIAATNYEELLDHAVFRRFDALLRFTLPTRDQIVSLLRLRLKAFKVQPKILQALAAKAEGLSFADVARACDDAIRSMILAGRKEVTRGDLEESFAEAVQRNSQVLSHKSL
jgi:SpoVK/Ycf46/Vps4 family AAA+-type ATPase